MDLKHKRGAYICVQLHSYRKIHNVKGHEITHPQKGESMTWLS